MRATTLHNVQLYVGKRNVATLAYNLPYALAKSLAEAAKSAGRCSYYKLPKNKLSTLTSIK